MPEPTMAQMVALTKKMAGIRDAQWKHAQNLWDVQQARIGERIPANRESRQQLLDRFSGDLTYTGYDKALQFMADFLPPACPPSVLPIDQLSPIFIRDLKCNMHHHGKYLLVRALTRPCADHYLTFIVEDETGDASELRLCFYHHIDDDPAYVRSFEQKGDVFLVKDPFLYILNTNEHYTIRLNHPSDILRLEPNHKLMPAKWRTISTDKNITADDWKQEGNKAFAKREYWVAIQRYTSALNSKPSTEEADTIRRNRALANLRVGNLDAAVEDTKCFASPPDHSEKSLYRASQALYGLRRYSECHEILQILNENFPSNSEAGKELAKTRLRLEEQKTGKYDFEKMIMVARSAKPPHLDHADYIGSVVVRSSPGQGEGLFTTKAVKAGELILCEKAFAHSYNAPPDVTNFCLVVNLLKKRPAWSGKTLGFINLIAHKLWKNPSLMADFNTLHRGGYNGVDVEEVDGRPVVDTYRIEEVVTLNSWGCPKTTSRFKDENQGLIYQGLSHCNGLWITASKMNHSCLPNVGYGFVGDFIIVRAAADLPPNTEIMTRYKYPDYEDHQQLNTHMSLWGFKCTCPLCTSARNTPNQILKKRNDWIAQIQKLTAQQDISRAERLLSSLEKTFSQPASAIPRLKLCNLYISIASYYNKVAQNPVKTRLFALKSLEALGYVFDEATKAGKALNVVKWGVSDSYTFDAWLQLYFSHMKSKDYCSQAFKKAEEFVRLAHRINFGEDGSFEDEWEKTSGGEKWLGADYYDDCRKQGMIPLVRRDRAR